MFEGVKIGVTCSVDGQAIVFVQSPTGEVPALAVDVYIANLEDWRVSGDHFRSSLHPDAARGMAHGAGVAITLGQVNGGECVEGLEQPQAALKGCL